MAIKEPIKYEVDIWCNEIRVITKVGHIAMGFFNAEFRNLSVNPENSYQITYGFCCAALVSAFIQKITGELNDCLAGCPHCVLTCVCRKVFTNNR